VINRIPLMRIKDEKLAYKVLRVIESVNSDKQLRATIAYLRLAREAALLDPTKTLLSAWINDFRIRQIAVLQRLSQLSPERTFH
jgi:hypothetical protein